MKTLTKSLLALSIAGFVLGGLMVGGVIHIGNAVGWYMALPLGAVFFGLFLSHLMLEKESALFDVEERGHRSLNFSDDRLADLENHASYPVKHAPAH